MAASANIAQMMSMAAPNYDDSTMQALGGFSLAAEGSYWACLSKGDELNWEKVLIVPIGEEWSWLSLYRFIISFDTIVFEEWVWRRPAGGKYSDDIYVSAQVDDCLIACKSATVMAPFKIQTRPSFSFRRN